MIKVTYAFPVFDDNKWIDKIVASKLNKDILFNAVDQVDLQALMECDFDNTIIIARGISYLTLSKKFRHGRIIELAVTGYDIMRGINQCKTLYNAKKIAVILSENIVVEKEFIENIMGVELIVFLVRDSTQLVDVYRKIKKMDIDAILGGMTVYRMAVRDALNCVTITVGHEAAKLVINEAFSVANAIIEERKKNELLKIILESSNEGIMAIDNLGCINAYNASVYKTLNIPSSTVLNGKKISSLIPALAGELNFLGDYQEANVLRNINNKMVVFNKVPIKVEEKCLGTVLVFQNVDKLQKTEIDIRQKLSKKGLFAKYDFENIIGKSQEIIKTIIIAKKYAKARSKVLIIGETGTGKELFAQSIHKNSSRKDEPFVAINCAALPEDLLESELFGYVEGAFTGAVKGGKSGLFELAHKGTLFLDEIAELPLGLQAKLLRVLQENEIRKLGDDKIIPIDVRIIAASNVDLKQKIAANKFRQDLLYRLDILRLSIPPLRERKSDIREIANHFLSAFMDQGEERIQLTEKAIVELIKYDWPGNIRELRNICERLTVLCQNNKIDGDDVIEVFNLRHAPQDLEAQLDNEINTNSEVESEKMTRKEIAELLGISRTTLWRKTR